MHDYVTRRFWFLGGVISASVCLLLLAGCKSPTAEEEAQHRADQQARLQRETQRRAEGDARRASERQRNEAEQLKRKYERYSTSELKLMHEHYLSLSRSPGSGRDLNVKVNSLFRSDSDEKNTERVIELERELLRRWKGGDPEAQLPGFEEMVSPGAPK